MLHCETLVCVVEEREEEEVMVLVVEEREEEEVMVLVVSNNGVFAGTFL